MQLYYTPIHSFPPILYMSLSTSTSPQIANTLSMPSSLLNPNSPPYFLTPLPPPPPRFFYIFSPFNFYYIHKPIINPNYYTFIPTTRLSLPPPLPPHFSNEEAVPAKEEQNDLYMKDEKPVTVYWKPKGRHQQQSQSMCRNSYKYHVRKRKSAAAAAAALALPPADFEFKAEEEAERTTVMIKNIPNCFDKKRVMELLDEHCLKENQKLQIDGSEGPNSEFDFLYLPMDFWSGCNLGYAFVNFTSPAAAWRLFHELHKKSWDSTSGSRKICVVTYARIQGLPALLSHFKDSIFTCANGEYLPVRFTPGRDGQRDTEQQRVGRHIPKGLKKMV